MDQSENSGRRTGVGKWLVVSLAGNLFLAGLAVGSFLARPWHPGPPPRPPLQMMVQEASGKLSPEGLKKLSALADELEEGFRKGMWAADAQRANIQSALLREPFDPEAFTKALDEMNVTFSRSREVANRRFAEVIATLSAADRRQLARVRFP